jgi:hypothetical protein
MIKKRRKSLKEHHFKRWKQRINIYVLNHIGFELDELPDMPYRHWFEKSNLKPKDIYNVVVANFYLLNLDIYG